MRSILIVLLALSLSSCVVYDHWDMCETMRKGDEVTFTYPAPDNPIAREIKIKRESLPRKCDKFMYEYDESEWDEQMEEYPRNDAWVECMGVGYK